MHLHRFIFLACVVSNISASYIKRADLQFNCGTPSPDPEHLAITKNLAAQELIDSNNGLISQATVNINVHFHVVAASESVADGFITVSSAF